MDMSFIIFYANQNECYYSDMSELKSAPLSTFPYGTEYVL